MLTGDLSQTSYSSIRAGILSFRRLCEQVQYGVFIFQFCRPVWQSFIEAAVLGGQLDARDYQANRADYLAVQWHTPKWAWVDPEKDVKGEILAIRAGLKARSMSINEAGMDEEDVDRQIAKDNERADDLELVFDSDPRKTAPPAGGAGGTLGKGGGETETEGGDKPPAKPPARSLLPRSAPERSLASEANLSAAPRGARVFGVPLMVQIDKLMVILDAIGPRIGTARARRGRGACPSW